MGFRYQFAQPQFGVDDMKGAFTDTTPRPPGWSVLRQPATCLAEPGGNAVNYSRTGR